MDLEKGSVRVQFGCFWCRRPSTGVQQGDQPGQVGQLGVQGVGSNGGGGVVAGVMVGAPAAAVVGETVGGASA